jgi:hypothetical protein
MAAKEELHELVERLPEDRLETARRLIDEARETTKAGQWFTLEQIKRENGL